MVKRIITPIVIFLVSIVVTIIAIVLYYFYSPPSQDQVPLLIELLIWAALFIDVISLGWIAAEL